LLQLDALAGTIAFKHCDDNNPRSRPLLIVTASIDRVVAHHRCVLGGML
jgi:acyl-coenzyme A thioesterase 9